jgi:membrane protein DedA with SNARE-associated domain
MSVSLALAPTLPWSSQGMPPTDEDGLTGLTGLVADIITQAGELGVASLVFLETVFPPLPSEAVLGIAGWEASMGRMHLPLVVLAATVGAVLGALVLYALGAWFGEERAKTMLARVPLVDRDDLDAASDFFRRHGTRIVFFGRFVPIVRSLVSVPAGAQRMPLARFVALTALGSGAWNAVLIGAGYLLGTQYHAFEAYLGYLDYVLLVAVMAFAGWYLVRWNRKHRPVPVVEEVAVRERPDA